MSETAEQRYSVGEVARLLRVHPATVYRMISAKRLEAERHGTSGRAIRVTSGAIAVYLAAVRA